MQHRNRIAHDVRQYDDKMPDKDPQCPGNASYLAVYLQKYKSIGYRGYIHGGSKVVEQQIFPLEVITADAQRRRDPQQYIQSRSQQTDLKAVDQAAHELGRGRENILIPLQGKALWREGHYRRGGKGSDDDDHQRCQQKAHHQYRNQPA